MLGILQNRTYRNLFLAQLVALLGTGLATVALALLAYDLAGPNAGLVLGTALAIKMLAYVGIAPLAAAIAERLSRRRLLVSLDLVRAAVVLGLPFVTDIWQVYALIFLLQSASAAFTPMFQATIPDVLVEEKDYTRALSLSRLAYDLENLLSPMLAAALLTVIAFSDLFVGTAIGFAISALLVLSVRLPARKTEGQNTKESFMQRVTRGLRIYLATPRLRGLLAINLTVASAGAMVIVNTVVMVQTNFGLGEQATAFAFAAFGFGSMIAALGLPLVLDRMSDRPVVLAGAGIMLIGLIVGSRLPTYGPLIALWFFLGFGYAVAQTPAGRLLRRSAPTDDRPAVFAAQFTLSHAMWLVAYPLRAGSAHRSGWPPLSSYWPVSPHSGLLVRFCFGRDTIQMLLITNMITSQQIVRTGKMVRRLAITPMPMTTSSTCNTQLGHAGPKEPSMAVLLCISPGRVAPNRCFGLFPAVRYRQHEGRVRAVLCHLHRIIEGSKGARSHHAQTLDLGTQWQVKRRPSPDGPKRSPDQLDRQNKQGDLDRHEEGLFWQDPRQLRTTPGAQ